MLRTMKVIWGKWKGFAHRLIDWQNRILMALVYILAVAPVGLVFKLMGRRLLDRAEPEEGAASYWQERSEPALDMERARRMF